MDPTKKGIEKLRKKATITLRPTKKDTFRKDKKEVTVGDIGEKGKLIIKEKTKVKKIGKLKLSASTPRVKTTRRKPKTPDYLDTGELLRHVTKQEYKSVDHIYSYPINEHLRQDFDSIVLEPKKSTIILCIYTVNTVGIHPFLQFMLCKYPSDYRKESMKDVMILPFLPYSGSSDIISFTQKFIKKIIPKFDTSIPMDGFIERGKSVYVFQNIGNIDHEKYLIQHNKDKSNRNKKWWWTMIYEIVNIKKNINFPIHASVTNMFLRYPYLNYLLDGDGKPYEIPNVGYHGTYYKLADMIETFGIQASKLNSMYGPYYYFGSFRKAVRYAGWTSTYKPRYIDGEMVTDEDGRYISMEDPEKGNPGAIIKFALFLGKTKVFLNHESDRDDLPLEEVELLKKTNPLSWKYLTRKLHDYQGTWTKEYNSVYGGEVILANGSRSMSNPEFVLNNFDQQLLLGSYLLDKNSLQVNWDPKYEGYNIV